MTPSRHEHKFVISREERERVIEAASGSLVCDGHGVDGRYRVSSLYYDTPGLAAFLEKLDGEQQRRKYRLRYYAAASEPGFEIRAAFLEIKHRTGETVYKERVRLTSDGAEALLSGAAPLDALDEHVHPDTENRRSTLAEIIRAAIRLRLRPVNVITYIREAWAALDDPALRITFDDDCRVLAPAAYEEVGTPAGPLLLPAGKCLMEIKFDGQLPRWLLAIMAARGLVQRRFSKYARGVEVAGTRPRTMGAPACILETSTRIPSAPACTPGAPACGEAAAGIARGRSVPTHASQLTQTRHA